MITRLGINNKRLKTWRKKVRSGRIQDGVTFMMIESVSHNSCSTLVR